MKALVATTCVAILVALGWFGLREYELSQERAAEAKMLQCIRNQMSSIDKMTAELAAMQCAFIVD